jgi:hypothetical protein
VAEKMGAESGMVVNVIVAINVPDPRSLPLRESDLWLCRTIYGDNTSRDIVLIVSQELLGFSIVLHLASDPVLRQKLAQLTVANLFSETAFDIQTYCRMISGA